jgi:hypothetical protein
LACFGVNLSNDIVHLFVRLGHHLFGFLSELVGTANRGSEKRIQRLTHFGKILRKPHGGDTENDTGQQRGLESGRAYSNDGHRRYRRNNIAAIICAIIDGFGGGGRGVFSGSTETAVTVKSSRRH